MPKAAHCSGCCDKHNRVCQTAYEKTPQLHIPDYSSVEDPSQPPENHISAESKEYITELNFISEKKTNNQTHTGQKFISANCDRGNDTMQLNFISNNQQ